MSRVYITTDDLDDDDRHPEFKFNPNGFLTYWLTLKNRSLLSKYLYFQYMQTRSNVASSIILQIFVSIAVIFKSWSTFVITQSPLSLVNFLFALVFIVALGWSGVFLKVRSRKVNVTSSAYYTMVIESAWLFCFNIWYMVNLILSSKQSCDMTKLGESHGCGYFSMADNKMLISMLLPMMSYMIMRCAKWEVVVTSYLINVGVILTCLYILKFEITQLVFWTFFPFTSLALLEYQRQLLYQFASVITQQGILDEKSRRFDEMQRNQLKHLIGNVAHDLKTPLLSFVRGVELIKANAEEMGSSLLKDHIDRNSLIEQISDILEGAENVLNTNNFMMMTINRCIDYTKVSNKVKLVPRNDEINLQDTIDLPVRCVKDLQTDKICVIAHPLPPNMIANVVTDKLWLQENLLCLMTNAVKYSTIGNVTLTVSLTSPSRKVSVPTLMVNTFNTEESATYQLELFSNCDDDRTTIASTSAPMVMRFEVEDSGIGLTREVMANLFRPSKQAERLKGGTGLGLYNLAKRMEALGGCYGVQRRRDGKRGSVFWFEIPYKPVVEAPPVISLSLPSIKSSDAEDDSVCSVPEMEEPLQLNILVVDDSPFILKTCKQMFKRAGHNVTVVENGAEALEIMKQNKQGPHKDVFDVVLMDLQMPVMDGLESTQQLRAYEEEFCKTNVTTDKYDENASFDGNKDPSHLLVIGVSSMADKETIKEAFIAGVDAFIPKPFNLKSFSEVYTSLISRPAGY